MRRTPWKRVPARLSMSSMMTEPSECASTLTRPLQPGWAATKAVYLALSCVEIASTMRCELTALE